MFFSGIANILKQILAEAKLILAEDRKQTALLTDIKGLLTPPPPGPAASLVVTLGNPVQQ